ncbi:MAG: hypothetical protein V4480_02475 [Patescibacteria group bacterium]
MNIERKEAVSKPASVELQAERENCLREMLPKLREIAAPQTRMLQAEFAVGIEKNVERIKHIASPSELDAMAQKLVALGMPAEPDDAGNPGSFNSLPFRLTTLSRELTELESEKDEERELGAHSFRPKFEHGSRLERIDFAVKEIGRWIGKSETYLSGGF